MPYLAVYAASLEFWKDHPNWALCDESGQPLTFMDFLGLMDPTSGSPWITHLQRECARVLAELPFDGFHIDQYGDPKEAFNFKGERVDLPNAFDQFIHTLKGTFPNKVVTFNAVGNWPIETLAASPQDFVYIEVWPPRTRYRDLPDIVLEARKLSGGKPVVIALYLPADRPANIRLADALIFSSGGARIELGERARLLSDPYFPKHQGIPEDLSLTLRKYYDFSVRYEELLGPFAGHGPVEQINAPAGVWKTIRTSPGKMVLCLVNLTALGDSGWDQAHPAPPSLTDVPVKVLTPAPVRQVWWGSPDGENLDLQRVDWSADDDLVQSFLPHFEYWGVLVYELDDQERG
jgi:dextranase